MLTWWTDETHERGLKLYFQVVRTKQPLHLQYFLLHRAESILRADESHLKSTVKPPLPALQEQSQLASCAYGQSIQDLTSLYSQFLSPQSSASASKQLCNNGRQEAEVTSWNWDRTNLLWTCITISCLSTISFVFLVCTKVVFLSVFF